MLYSVTYLNDSKQVVNMEPVTTTTVQVEDGEIYLQWINGEIRCKFIDGRLIEDTDEVSIEENVVPPGEMVGIPKDEFEAMEDGEDDEDV